MINRSRVSNLLFTGVLAAGVGFSWTPVRADDPAPAGKTDDSSSPEAIFKAKGLSKNGFRLVLPIETEMHDAARSIKVAKGKQNIDAKAVKDLDAKIKTAKDSLHQMDADYQRGNDALAAAADREQQNQIIAQINSLTSKIKDQNEAVEELVEKKKKLTDGKEAYVDAVVEASDKADSAAHAYDDLVNDTELIGAIDKANENQKTKLKLGPSPYFVEDLKFIEQCRAEITMVVLPVVTEHGVPEVEATINGKKHSMVWDSGASMVTLSWIDAADVGLHPTEKDPTVQAKLADGKIVKAKKMTIKTIVVGEFTVNDVDCIVMPEDLKDVDSLLGDTFQNHFLAKLDQTAGQLRLTPLDTSTVKKTVGLKATPAKSN